MRNLKRCNYIDQAIKRDSSFASKVKNVVVLGGAFFALGNVNPAAEANVSARFSFFLSFFVFFFFFVFLFFFLFLKEYMPSLDGIVVLCHVLQVL